MTGSPNSRASTSRALREARERLRNVERLEPEAIRRTAGSAIRQAADGAAGTFWTLAETDDGMELHGATDDGSIDLGAFWRGLRLLTWPAAHFNPWRPRPRSVNRFENASAGSFRQQIVRSGAYDAMYRPIHLIDQLRVYLYRGSEFLGTVGTGRLDGAAYFTARDAARCQLLVPDLLAVVSAAASAERGEPADFVVRADGTIEFASTTGQPWLLRDGFRDELGRVVRALDARSELQREGPRSLLLKHACASWLRLDGASGHGEHRYLIHVRAIKPAHREETLLTPTQTKVAEYLVAGATVSEAAAAMCVSPETVRSHVKAIYARLDVSSRAELVGKLS